MILLSSKPLVAAAQGVSLNFLVRVGGDQSYPDQLDGPNKPVSLRTG